MLSYDVIVIGAGPAGLATAIKCRKLGYDVLVLEKCGFGRVKACAGITPQVTLDIIEAEIGLHLPSGLLAYPPYVGLYLIGLLSRGIRENYRLVNLDRSMFDAWLSVKAMKYGVDLRYMVSDIKIREFHEGIEVGGKLKQGNNTTFFARYLVGADGASSQLRNICYPNLKSNAIIVLQEMWMCHGNFGDYFYMMILDQEITPIYGYIVPKKENIYLVGIGVFPWQHRLAVSYLHRFKRWLKDDMKFKPIKLIRRECGKIPFDEPVIGRGNIILVGDAGGFTNTFTGEGIRQALWSGFIAAESIKIADTENKYLDEVYSEFIKWDVIAAKKSRILVSKDFEDREKFIENQIGKPKYERLP